MKWKPIKSDRGPLKPEEFGFDEVRAYSVKEIAFRLSVSEDTIMREIHDGRLLALKSRRGYSVSYPRIAKYIAEMSSVVPED